MHSSQVGKKNNHEAQVALTNVSKLLSRLATSRKAPSKLQDIIDLTREVARLQRSMHADGSGADDGGNGRPDHFANIPVRSANAGLVR